MIYAVNKQLRSYKCHELNVSRCIELLDYKLGHVIDIILSLNSSTQLRYWLQQCLFY